MNSNCPFCNSDFGQTSEFMFGCTDNKCPEQPRIHDPVGDPDMIDEFWEKTIKDAPTVKQIKMLQWMELTKNINKYYSPNE